MQAKVNISGKGLGAFESIHDVVETLIKISSLKIEEGEAISNTFALPEALLNDKNLQTKAGKMIDYNIRHDAEAKEVINWWIPLLGPGSQLIPLTTAGDGNCLLHAVSLAMFGFDDANSTLRTALADFFCDSIFKTPLKRRWLLEFLTCNKKLNVRLTSDQIDNEWNILEEYVKDSSTETSPAAGLEDIHLSALSNLIKRPIICFASKTHFGLRHLPGEVPFQGIYLPYLHDPEICYMNPLFIYYDFGHFSALVPTDNKTILIPLIDNIGIMMRARFMQDPGAEFNFLTDSIPESIHLPHALHMDLLSQYLTIVTVGADGSPISENIGFFEEPEIKQPLTLFQLGRKSALAQPFPCVQVFIDTNTPQYEMMESHHLLSPKSLPTDAGDASISNTLSLLKVPESLLRQPITQSELTIEKLSLNTPTGDGSENDANDDDTDTDSVTTVVDRATYLAKNNSVANDVEYEQLDTPDEELTPEEDTSPSEKETEAPDIYIPPLQFEDEQDLEIPEEIEEMLSPIESSTAYLERGTYDATGPIPILKEMKDTDMDIEDIDEAATLSDLPLRYIPSVERISDLKEPETDASAEYLSRGVYDATGAAPILQSEDDIALLGDFEKKVLVTETVPSDDSNTNYAVETPEISANGVSSPLSSEGNIEQVEQPTFIYFKNDIYEGRTTLEMLDRTMMALSGPAEDAELGEPDEVGHPILDIMLSSENDPVLSADDSDSGSDELEREE